MRPKFQKRSALKLDGRIIQQSKATLDNENSNNERSEVRLESRNEVQISKTNNQKDTIGVLKFVNRIIQ